VSRAADVLHVLSPVSGTSHEVSDVPDPVFASGMVGPGLAIEPDRSVQTAVSPIAGRLAKLHPHAFLVVSASGPAVLVHLGIDTVHLHGAGFDMLAT
jgi:PTS system glucose-specific IIA component